MTPPIGEFQNIREVWETLDQGITIYWSSTAYKLTVEDIRTGRPEDKEYWNRHFSFRNGKVLRVTYISNWYGSLLNESEIKFLFTIY